MRKRRLQQRVFSHTVRQMKRQASGEELELLKMALSDRVILEMAYSETMEQLAHDSSQSSVSISRLSDGTPVVENLLKLLDWFVNNGPAIIDVIRLISGLFGGVDEANAMLREAAIEDRLEQVHFDASDFGLGYEHEGEDQ